MKADETGYCTGLLAAQMLAAAHSNRLFAAGRLDAANALADIATELLELREKVTARGA